MGVGQSISDAMAENQRKIMDEQMKKQWEMQKRAQERMRRVQISFQMAVVQERFYWMATAYSGSLLGLTINFLKTKSFPKVAIPPLYIGGFALAYQYDFAFGNKINRINEMATKLQNSPEYWFSPIDELPKKDQK